MAFAAFRNLKHAWGHTSISLDRKVELFNAIVVPKMLYGLSTVWLNAAERRRLNGAQARMLRSISGIKHSMISRVSNDEVRRITKQIPVTDTLLKHQLDLYCKAAQGGEECPLRDSVFYPKTLTPVNDMYVRKTGAPRLEWAKQLHPHALRDRQDFRARLSACRADAP